MTKEKSWSKPDILKSEEEKMYSVDWEELTTNDGRTFYYNSKLGKSVWRMPPELKAMRERMEALKANEEGNKVKPTDFDMNFNITINSNLDEGADGTGAYDEGKAITMSKEEARRIFTSLLKEKNISMTMKWEQVNNFLKNEERFHVIKTMKEKRQIFQDYISQVKKEERNEARKKLENNKDIFKRMLIESNVLTSDKSFSFVQQLFSSDPRWKALDEKDRENLVQDYLDELYDQEKDEEKKRRNQYCSKVKELLASMKEVTVNTTWEQINKMLKNNMVWKLMPDIDKLDTFIEFIEKKEKTAEEAKRREVKNVERKNRESFRNTLMDAILGRNLTFKTKWKQFLSLYKEDERCISMFRQHGSTPRELFEDVRDTLVDKHKIVKDDFKKVLKNCPEMFETASSILEFRDLLLQFEEFQNFEHRETNNLEYYAEYLFEKYKKREEKSIKKYYKFLIKEIPEPEAESFSNVEEKIQANSANISYFNCLSQKLKEKLFNTYKEKIKLSEDPVELLGKRKDKKKKRKDKKRKEKREKSSRNKEDHDRNGYKASRQRKSDQDSFSKDRKQEISDDETSKSVDKMKYFHENKEKEANESNDKIKANIDIKFTSGFQDGGPNKTDQDVEVHNNTKKGMAEEIKPFDKTGKRKNSHNDGKSSSSSDSEEEGEIKNPNMYLKMNKYESRGKDREKYRDKKKNKRNDSRSRSRSRSASSLSNSYSHEKRKKRRRR